MFLTLIFNGSTTQFLLHMLGMDKLSSTKVSLSSIGSSLVLKGFLVTEILISILYPLFLVVKAMFYVLLLSLCL